MDCKSNLIERFRRGHRIVQYYDPHHADENSATDALIAEGRATASPWEYTEAFGVIRRVAKGIAPEGE
jgi:hypothetical protein